jgi:hypothetical protein
MGVMSAMIGLIGGRVSATAAPPNLSSGGVTPGFTTASTHVSTSGGSGTYSYSWGVVGSTHSLTINSPSSATTTFSGAGVAKDTICDATVKCTVTDTVIGGSVEVSLAISYTRTDTSGA